MKLKFSCFTILILFVSVDCGLVKNFFGNVKEDVHTVVDNTVNIIGKETHKITEGLGVFMHRNEGNKFPGYQSGPVRPNQLPNGNNIDNSNNYNPTNNNREENNDTGNNKNISQYYDSVQTTPVNDNVYNKFPGHQSVTHNNQSSNDDKTDNTHGSTDNKLEENINAGVNENNSQYNTVQSTSATVEASVNGNVHDAQNSAHSKPTTEFNINKNEEQGIITNKVDQPEATSNKNIHEHTMESTTTKNVATTTEVDPWLNGAELENILPIIKHNDTHFAGSKTVNTDTGSYTDTNELGTGENLPNNTNEDSNNKKGKCDENTKPAESDANGDKAVISDQMFFKDNKPKPTGSTHYICAKPLVRAANGDCLEPIEIDVRKKNEPRAYNIFEADGCASGYARAQDNTCQKIVG